MARARFKNQQRIHQLKTRPHRKQQLLTISEGKEGNLLLEANPHLEEMKNRLLELQAEQEDRQDSSRGIETCRGGTTCTICRNWSHWWRLWGTEYRRTIRWGRWADCVPYCDAWPSSKQTRYWGWFACCDDSERQQYLLTVFYNFNHSII